MILSIAEIFASIIVTFPIGAYTGLKLRGAIPLRSPNNSVRLANAKTDVDIAEAAVERRKAELQLDYIEVEGQKRISEAQREMKMLETGKAHEVTEAKVVTWAKLQFPHAGIGSTTNIDDVLHILTTEIAADQNSIECADKIIEAAKRFYSGKNIPGYFSLVLRNYCYTRDIPYE